VKHKKLHILNSSLKRAGIELAAEQFGTEAANEQSFFAVAEHLLSPGGEAAVD
jgi:hypothetical protein